MLSLLFSAHAVKDGMFLFHQETRTRLASGPALALVYLVSLGNGGVVPVWDPWCNPPTPTNQQSVTQMGKSGSFHSEGQEEFIADFFHTSDALFLIPDLGCLRFQKPLESKLEPK